MGKPSNDLKHTDDQRSGHCFALLPIELRAGLGMQRTKAVSTECLVYAERTLYVYLVNVHKDPVGFKVTLGELV